VAEDGWKGGKGDRRGRKPKRDEGSWIEERDGEVGSRALPRVGQIESRGGGRAVGSACCRTSY